MLDWTASASPCSWIPPWPQNTAVFHFVSVFTEQTVRIIQLPGCLSKAKAASAMAGARCSCVILRNDSDKTTQCVRWTSRMSAGLLHDWANIGVRAQSCMDFPSRVQQSPAAPSGEGVMCERLTWPSMLQSVIKPDYKNVYNPYWIRYTVIRFTLYCRLCTALVHESLQKVQNYLLGKAVV